MDWFFLFLLAGAAIAIWRVVYQVRRVRAMPTDDWDAKLIERLRRGGTDPFRPLELDFFVALPTREATDAVAAILATEGYAVDVRELVDSVDQPFSVHALKTMHLTADRVQASSTRLRELAAQFGGRYDGWAPGRVISDARSDV
ncbi:MAG: ribonuclease E inhibitor RraB [Gammaproteobacteria bacterium]|jgi:regulator of RNase E activity RraB|nr:ribonuclease E inhibitor RraB [Gammaproteobacteria bacterium]NBX41693.1 ribonuclease E inhibitor RraB [Gammaproteobacteria bacterium]